MIRIATRADIDQIAEIHMRALPGDLLPRLGKKYLVNEFYPLVLNPDLALNLVNEEDGVINAFCIFAYDGQKIFKLVSRNKLVLIRYLVKSIIIDFSLIIEVLSLLKGSRYQLSDDDKVLVEKGVPEIYIIASDPKSQSKGIGARIIANGFPILFENHSACLVKTSSPRAMSFYLRNGFSLIGEEYRGKRTLHLLIRKA